MCSGLSSGPVNPSLKTPSPRTPYQTSRSYTTTPTSKNRGVWETRSFSPHRSPPGPVLGDSVSCRELTQFPNLTLTKSPLGLTGRESFKTRQLLMRTHKYYPQGRWISFWSPEGGEGRGRLLTTRDPSRQLLPLLLNLLTDVIYYGITRILSFPSLYWFRILVCVFNTPYLTCGNKITSNVPSLTDPNLGSVSSEGSIR